jgi:hypothetical protein
MTAIQESVCISMIRRMTIKVSSTMMRKRKMTTRLIERIVATQVTRKWVPPSDPTSSKTITGAPLADVNALNLPNVALSASPSMRKTSETLNLPLVIMPSVLEAKRANTVSQYPSHSIST